MEKILLKLARQLNAYDEASLMSLWEKYAQQVQRFEPTKRWEEASLVLGMIQALRWKNQLFNYHWSQAAKPDPSDRPRLQSADSLMDAMALERSGERSGADKGLANGEGAAGDSVQQRTKVLRFRPRETDDPV